MRRCSASSSFGVDATQHLGGLRGRAVRLFGCLGRAQARPPSVFVDQFVTCDPGDPARELGLVDGNRLDREGVAERGLNHVVGVVKPPAPHVGS